MAKPRVFVSSTYYDLKYVRERLEQLINSFCLEPILFESDHVYFEHGKPLDTSCYSEVHNCHLMVLIVSGRYGSLATTPNEKEGYDKGHVSITQKEYITAKEKGIPVMIFVDANVLADYRTYQQNKASIPSDFKFAHTDTIKVFEFISILESSAIKAYDKIDDIEHYFSNQISGMLFTYLTQLQSKKENNKIRNVVEQIKFASSSMQDMINNIGEIILKDDREKYEKLIDQQNKSLIDFFLELFKQNVVCGNQMFLDDKRLIELKQILLNTLFDFTNISKIPQEDKSFENISKLADKCIEKSNLVWDNAYTKIHVHAFHSQLIQIAKLVTKDEKLMNYFEEKLIPIIKYIIEPF